jgi:hypothetical protein
VGCAGDYFLHLNAVNGESSGRELSVSEDGGWEVEEPGLPRRDNDCATLAGWAASLSIVDGLALPCPALAPCQRGPDGHSVGHSDISLGRSASKRGSEQQQIDTEDWYRGEHASRASLLTDANWTA